MFNVDRIYCRVHDTSYGGYKYKVTARISITELVAFKKLKGDLGSLVLDVNNALYRMNKNIPAHNPSVEVFKAKRGVKCIEFTYFFNDDIKAEAMGIEMIKRKNGEVITPKYTSFSTVYEAA